MTRPDIGDIPDGDDGEPTPEDHVRAFRLTSSAAAFRLAVIAATQPLFPMELLQTVRRETGAEFGDLAEFVLADLVEILPGGVDLFRYRDTDVRKSIARRLCADDVWMIRRVTADFAAHAPDFAAVAADPLAILGFPWGAQ